MSTDATDFPIEIQLDKTEEMFTKKQLWDAIGEQGQYIKKQAETIEKLRAVLTLPDFEGLSCECGYYDEDSEETGMTECLLCASKRVLEETKELKGEE